MPGAKPIAVVALGIVSIIYLSTNENYAYATPIPIFEPVDHTYNLTIGNQSYPIKWGTLGNGTVESMQANYTSKSIRITIKDNRADQGGLFFIELPRNVIDANSTTSIGCTEFGNSDPSKDWQTHDIEYNVSVTSATTGKPLPEPTGLFENQYPKGGELCARYSRTFNIYYPPGETNILIQGNVMIPEFPTNLMATMVGITSLAVATTLLYRRLADNYSTSKLNR